VYALRGRLVGWNKLERTASVNRLALDRISGPTPDAQSSAAHQPSYSQSQA
jgi:hypothetical protein